MRIARPILPLLAASVLVSSAAAEVPLSEGLGEGENARLGMRFEVTFMKIDVADIEARLSPETAAVVDSILATEENEGDARKAVQAAILDAESLLISMRYLRDSSHGRLLKGMRNGFEAARKSDMLEEPVMERTYGEISSEFDVLEERGVLEGDVLVYRLDGDDLKVRYVGPDGVELVSAEYSGEEWALGTKGAFFGKKSRFREKLVKSAFERKRRDES